VQPVVPRVACAVLVLGLAIAGVADAAVSPLWLELGGSASGGGVSQAAGPAAVRDGAVDVGSDGRPVVAYTEYPDPAATQGAITVKRWTGSAWKTLSGAGGIGWGYAPQVRISPSGAIHVAWLHDGAGGNTEVRLRVRAGTTFDELGGSDSPGGLSGANRGIAAPLSLALDGVGYPLVAFRGVVENGVVAVTPTPALIDGTVQVYVRRWTGSAWEFVGSDFTGGGASGALSFESDGGDASFHGAEGPALAVDGAGTPVVAFTYLTAVNDDPAASADIHVTRWNGTTWDAVGPAGGVSNSHTGSLNASLAADATGRLALAWEEDVPAGATSVWVRVWNRSVWEELAGSATGRGFTQPGTINRLPRVALDPAGRPLVAWRARTDLAGPSQIFVLRWNGGDAWEEMGLDSATNAGISDARLDVGAPALALAPSGGSATAGVPTVAWIDVRQTGPGQVFLRQFDAGATAALDTAATIVRLSMAVSTPAGTLGQGAVGTISGPAGTCGIDGIGCTADVVPGTQVVLTASPEPGNRFLRWSGGPCDGRTKATCQFTLAADKRTTALFRGVTGVQVLKAGNGAGTVTGTGFACGADCFEEVFTGKKRTLTPAAATGSRFLGWSGNACDGQASGDCSFTAVGINQSITATFELQSQQLTVADRPNGRVVNLPPLPDGTIDCGNGNAVCTAVLDFGTQVALSATPIAGHRFVKWTGDVCAGLKNATCTFKIKTRDVSVAATFQPVFSLAVTKSGNSKGTITGPGIKCGSDCDETYLGGKRVTLTRSAPITGTVFRWLGDCASRGAKETCTLTMKANRSVGAEYKLRPLRLTVKKVRPSLGTVSGLVGGVTCGADECFVVDYGTPVTLLATAATSPASEFVSWAGCKTVSDTSCSFTMKATRTVTATFRPQVSSVTVELPSTGPLIVGGTRQLTAVANFTDGSQEDVTTRASWSSGIPAIVKVSTVGRVTGVAVGSTEITATFRTTPSSPVVVTVDRLLSITKVSCRPYGDQTGDAQLLKCLPSGRSFEVHCDGTGTFAGDPADPNADITDQVRWFSTNTAIASSTGFVTFSGPVRQSFRILGAGTAVLYAKQGSKRSATTGKLGRDAWVVQGKGQTLNGAPQIAPDSTSVGVNGQVQLQAMAAFLPTAACPLPPPRDFALLVQWISSSKAFAEVNFFGRVTGRAPGSVTITATYGKMTDTATVEVNP